jgi:BioD-like phosphotransacetylase family protein
LQPIALPSLNLKLATDLRAIHVIVARLQEQYRKEILPALQKALNQKNPMAVPKIEKITINMFIHIQIIFK